VYVRAYEHERVHVHVHVHVHLYVGREVYDLALTDSNRHTVISMAYSYLSSSYLLSSYLPSPSLSLPPKKQSWTSHQ
jgi:hypothetical protein